MLLYEPACVSNIAPFTADFMDLESLAFSAQGKNVHQQMDNANAIGFLTQPTCQTGIQTP